MPAMLIDPRLMSRAGALYPSLATIMAPVETRGTVGQTIRTWSTVVLKNAKCRVAPLIEVRPTSAETRTQDMIRTDNTRQILFPAYYPQILTNMRCIADGITYDVMAIEFDGNKLTTRLRVELVRI